MTSGIFNYTSDEAWIHELLYNPLRLWLPEELADIGFSHDFVFVPGSDWQYSNTNTILVGMIIEKATGNSLEQEIENRIVEPLNLSNTGLITSGLDLPGHHGRGYYIGEYVENHDVTETIDVSWSWAAGSAYSTPGDLQKYVEHLVGGGLLSHALQQKRLDDIHTVDGSTGYGLAIAKRGTFYGHNGALPGFASSMYHSIEKDCTVIIYFNSLLGYHPDFLFYRFMDILYGEVY